MNNIEKIAIVILTKNEELHIARCLDYCLKLTNNIYVVDSLSEDNTVCIAESKGANVIKREWDGYANQYNFINKYLQNKFEWIFRVDADEIVSNELVQEIKSMIKKLDNTFSGISIPRRITFLRQKIRYGGVFPCHLVRIARPKYSKCEGLIDEHIVVSGKIHYLKEELLDDSLISLSSWISKHNKYSSLEALQLFNSRKNKSYFDEKFKMSFKSRCRRIVKDKFFNNSPIFLRSLIYFLIRYILFFGFLDGIRGLGFHFLQAFWYRFIVDMKVYEILKKND
ncbi:glycosyltransferase family 2 protein [Prochlorococcus marinus]|uniref:glycosyltransferase family 2 protein n=1 Tax=Prochlorococcus marinus TaxID=1219 RepID=UPI00094DBA2A|nr:glycosyltransferase family 2 protein [Prochlorococcus marinus]